MSAQSIHGYKSYRPSPIAQKVLEASFKILFTYKAWESPMTIRQIFYRLIAEYGYPKTEKDYKSLIGWIARSRRARQGHILESLHQGLSYEVAQKIAFETRWMIPFSWIRDERGQGIDSLTYDSYIDFIDDTRRRAEEMRLPAQEGQPQILEIWCEAAGMVPLMREISNPWTLRVNSGGGYDSVTAKHDLAQRVVERVDQLELPTVVLHVGDFDPSGEGMYETLRDDVTAMVNGWKVSDHWLTINRVALTEEQVMDMQVETAPPKPKDARSKGFVERHPEVVEFFGGSEDITAQLEALTPPELRQLIVEQIESYIEPAPYEDVRERESDIRERLVEGIEEISSE